MKEFTVRDFIDYLKSLLSKLPNGDISLEFSDNIVVYIRDPYRGNIEFCSHIRKVIYSIDSDLESSIRTLKFKVYHRYHNFGLGTLELTEDELIRRIGRNKIIWHDI